MENATDALIMAFAVLIFIIALSVTLTSLSQAKSTADIVLFYSDRENFQIALKDDTDNFENGGRTVGVDTVIATIYRCAKEKFSVKIIDEDKTYIFEYDVQNNKQIQEKIQDFIQNHKKEAYRETYVEVITGGTVYVEQADETLEEKDLIITGTDGTQLERDVTKKIYITYQYI